MKRELRSVILLASLAVIATSCGTSTQPTNAVKSYKTVTIESVDSGVSTPYTASIRGSQSVEIRPQVTGVITDILIEEGAKIKKGERLFIIDQTPYRAALDVAEASVKSAEASVATAQLNADSGESLYDDQIISQNELLQLQNTLATAEATMAQAVAQRVNAANDLSYTVIKSPVNGVAGMIDYRVGSLVSSSIADPLVNVTNNDTMYAYFSMSESQLLTLSRASGSTEAMMKAMPKVKLTLRDGSDYDQLGCVDAISGTVDRSTGSVRLRAKFTNPNGVLRDGSSGRVIITDVMEDAIVIPQVATYEIQDKMFVYKVVDGKARSSQISIYPYDNGQTFVVTSGVEVGDEIIAEGAGLVREGTEVVSVK
ncbi:MAG: efflux RND transporter periplasmic adaptor subunit [Rikenellaceae bacterium]